jgi:peptidoglycan/xylan/chitin deacetylase (PgdA/CDA1 family)
MTPRVTVLAYHALGVCPRDKDEHNLFVTVDEFTRQMEFLARKRRVVDLDAAISGRVGSGAPAVAITFDDGYRNVLEKAAPILERHAFPATVFVPTAFVGSRNTWIEPTECDVEIMDPDELKAGEAAGLRMESHGHAHIDYGRASRAETDADLATSLDALESIVGRRPHYFAYPFGAHSPAAHEVVRAAGLRAAFTIDEPHGGDLAYERVQVTPLDGASLFALKSSGRYMRLRHGRVARTAYGAVKPVVRKVLGRGRR